MTTHVVFLQGGGAGAHAADALLAESLGRHLGAGYIVDIPLMPNEDEPDDEIWLPEIGEAIARAGSRRGPADSDSGGIDSGGIESAGTDLVDAESIVLVGHSLGGYLLLKYLSDNHLIADHASERRANHLPGRRIAAVCVIAAPFPGGDPAWTFDGFELPRNLGALLPAEAAVLLYASEDDAIVPFAHRDLYAAAIPQAITRTTFGGHQLANDLQVVAADIRSIIDALSAR
ncbi:putative alpha/beta hydrolase family esterase [Glaciihabitans tibetensis]|uniref:Putative alpha/beta hydrolase family esterase n=1 Tax=Glaciihabitans tibetensis TaxID=1266600 RepID=A0A2T0VDW1_9MICO|nr:alpha/beta fold hydrolase [Glaciihabitans tibetensis]PRY68312.1 putative alpha/beta hydrolase family esterase [Glaciihabitans tibetensis]